MTPHQMFSVASTMASRSRWVHVLLSKELRRAVSRGDLQEEVEVGRYGVAMHALARLPPPSVVITWRVQLHGASWKRVANANHDSSA